MNARCIIVAATVILVLSSCGSDPTGTSTTNEVATQQAKPGSEDALRAAVLQRLTSHMDGVPVPIGVYRQLFTSQDASPTTKDNLAIFVEKPVITSFVLGNKQIVGGKSITPILVGTKSAKLATRNGSRQGDAPDMQFKATVTIDEFNRCEPVILEVDAQQPITQDFLLAIKDADFCDPRGKAIPIKFFPNGKFFDGHGECSYETTSQTDSCITLLIPISSIQRMSISFMIKQGEFISKGGTEMYLSPKHAAAARLNQLKRETEAKEAASREADEPSEEKAVNAMKSAFFPAQIAFCSNSYVDQDADSKGEYGTIGELSGRTNAGKRTSGLSFISPLYLNGRAHGFRFRIWLPDGLGGAISSDDTDRVPNQEAANEQEKHFILYAWPETQDSKLKKVFAITESAMILESDWTGVEPVWNSALPEGWSSSKPGWKMRALK